MIFRQFFALIYDLLLVFSLIFTLIGIGIIIGIEGKIVFWIITLPASYFYFVFSWVKSGQTLGMKSWKLKINVKNYKQASLRFSLAILSFALFGLGFFYQLIDKNQQSLHDKLAKTKIILLK